LALAFLAGGWGKRELLSSAERVLGAKPSWLEHVVHRVLTHFRNPPQDDLYALRELIEASRSFRSAFAAPSPRPRIAEVFTGLSGMGQTRWPLPPLNNSQELAVVRSADLLAHGVRGRSLVQLTLWPRNGGREPSYAKCHAPRAR
jgi:hypothetical protein